MSEPHEQPQVDLDEAALDAELQASIDAVKAGNTPEPITQEQPEGTAATGETGTAPEGEGDGTPQPTGADGEEAEFRIPNKGKFESDESYEKRIELFDLVKRRKAATTPEAKEALSAEIKKAKGELKTLGTTERFTQPKVETPAGEVDPDSEADIATAKRLGLLTKEDAIELVQQERIAQEVQANLKTFVDRKTELKDEDIREVFFDFVDANYVWQGKSGKDLIAVLEMAHEAMFRPNETVQERVLKAAGVQEKVNAMQFPGGTGAKTTFSPEMQKSIDELKATGMSEDKAIELLSD